MKWTRHLRDIAAIEPDMREPKTSLRDRVGRSADENEGSMVIETALVLPIFFLLLIGIFQLSLLLVGFCSATYAANVGARYASLNSSSSLSPASATQIQNVVKSNLYLPGTSQAPVIIVYYGNQSPTGNYVGDLVGVGVIVFSYTYKIPYWGTNTFLLECQAYRYISR